MKAEKTTRLIIGLRSKTKIITFLLALIGLIFLIPGSSAQNATGISNENSCIDCHKTVSPYVAEEQQFNQIREQHLERNVTCSLECHADKVRQLATANFQQWSDSVHALKGVTCDFCHGGNPNQTDKDKAHEGIKNATDINSSVYYTNVPNTCGKCHSTELANFENSKHYQRLESLHTAPTCTTCHAPHTFSVLNPEEFRNFCETCHSVYKKIAPYDIPVQAEYLLGKVNKLKFDIQTTQQDIFFAKKNGTNVDGADQYINNALGMEENLTPMWHEFNLTRFENEVDSANAQVKLAENSVNTTDAPNPTAIPKTVPGFGVVSVIIALVVALAIWMRKV